MTQRTPSPVDAIAEDYFHRSMALSPIDATHQGEPGHDHLLDDFSPAGYAARAALRQETLAALAAATPVDDIDRVTLAAMRERLGLAEEIYAAGLDELDCNVLASPMQSIRSVFDLMDTSDDVSRTVFAVRLTKVAPALEQWTESLAAAAAKGLVPARRQVLACIAQCEQFTSDDGYFAGLVDTMSATEMSPELRVEMEEGIREAAAAYVDLATRLREQVLPTATEADAVGRERYSLFSRYFLGSTVDLEETYRWGQEELARIEALRAEVAEQIMPGSTPAEAIAYLDTDARFRLDGVDALREWMQARGDEAIAELADTHFDIPGPVRVLEGMIAPTQTGGIYYTGPSDDFSRPGRMWWSVPKGVTEFLTWRELTTVYHEGVPGHHLQVAQTVYRKETLNKWRRLSAWTSGHGEGWALYAERLMDELGYFAEPGNRMGWLDGQSLRAARVVIDIGVHCGFPAPAEVGGGEWDYDKAWTYLTSHANMDEAMLRFELDRYLGWPGQAPSYKIGERLWLQLREEARARDGDEFDLKDFHRRALDIGGVGLDTLRAAVLGTV
ncbi:conserved hypothetical protein [Nostocoides jenkinsii Ben 74]|uniref:DUF885 domain-containing protein n=2 Tax=Nostocoides jenkinsii TaxID=330834 RepID=A0A077MGJ2_9MICO|nr:conserved hypothetical protein [Tetrasphaera jenkinsii Ben 74]